MLKSDVWSLRIDFVRMNLDTNITAHARERLFLPSLRHAIDDPLVLMPRITKPDKPLFEQQARGSFEEFNATGVVGYRAIIGANQSRDPLLHIECGYWNLDFL